MLQEPLPIQQHLKHVCEAGRCNDLYRRLYLQEAGLRGDEGCLTSGET